jgi:hypothetical protein
VQECAQREPGRARRPRRDDVFEDRSFEKQVKQPTTASLIRRVPGLTSGTARGSNSFTGPIELGPRVGTVCAHVDVAGGTSTRTVTPT